MIGQVEKAADSNFSIATLPPVPSLAMSTLACVSEHLSTFSIVFFLEISSNEFDRENEALVPTRTHRRLAREPRCFKEKHVHTCWN